MAMSPSCDSTWRRLNEIIKILGVVKDVWTDRTIGTTVGQKWGVQFRRGGYCRFGRPCVGGGRRRRFGYRTHFRGRSIRGPSTVGPPSSHPTFTTNDRGRASGTEREMISALEGRKVTNEVTQVREMLASGVGGVYCARAPAKR